jgi:hypothetical protein
VRLESLGFAASNGYFSTRHIVSPPRIKATKLVAIFSAEDFLHSRSHSHSTTDYSLCCTSLLRHCIPILLTFVLAQQFSYKF